MKETYILTLSHEMFSNGRGFEQQQSQASANGMMRFGIFFYQLWFHLKVSMDAGDVLLGRKEEIKCRIF